MRPRGVTRMQEPEFEHHPEDQGNVRQVGDQLAEDLRRASAGEPTVQPSPAEFAPPADRVAESLKTGEAQIKDRVATIVEQVTAATVAQINGMRKQLDDFERLVIASGAASKASLEKHIGIAAGTLASIEQMGKQIADYSKQVEESIPQNGNNH